jgi:hypothetical protein
MKTLKQHCMLYGPDRDSFLCDFYHAMGCFFAVEDGLFRTEKQVDCYKFTFPDLHGMKNESVTKLLTKILRSHTAPELKASTTARGLRSGSNTILATHPDITVPEQFARGGWSAGNMDIYTKSNPKLSLPPMLALGGFKNPHARAYPPRLECLYDSSVDDQATIALVMGALERLMGKLYLVNVKQFMPEGELRPMLQTCTAAMLKDHCILSSEFGFANPAVVKLETAAKEAEIGHDASATLVTWSRKIRDDFEKRNTEIPAATSDSLLTTLDRHSDMFAQMLGLLTSGQQDVNSLKRTVGDLREDIKKQAMESQYFKTEVQRLNHLLHASQGTVGGGQSSPAASSQEEANKAVSPGEVAVPPLPTMTPPRAQATLFLAQAVPKISDKAISVGSILEQLYVSKRLHNAAVALADMDLTSVTPANKSKLKGALELAALSWTKEQETALRSPNLSKEELKTITTSIDAACITKLRGLEGKEPKGKDLPYFLSLGTRYLAWKKEEAEKNDLPQSPLKAAVGSLLGYFKKK